MNTDGEEERKGEVRDRTQLGQARRYGKYGNGKVKRGDVKAGITPFGQSRIGSFEIIYISGSIMSQSFISKSLWQNLD